MRTVVKVLAALWAVGYVYSIGERAGEEKVLSNMKMYIDGVKAGEKLKKTEDE